MSNQHLSPYKEKYPDNVREEYFQPQGPVEANIDMTKKLSKNLYLYELVQKSFVTDAEKNLFVYIPLDIRIPKAFQILRDVLGKPITVTSFFRSQRHELSKGRTGTSQHTNGMAIDLTGEGLVDLVLEALETKNELYQQLRAAGVNGFGVYKKKNFVHLDFRPANFLGGYAYWNGDDDNELKKKGSGTLLKIVGLVVAIPMLIYGGIKWYKNRKKKK